MSMTDRRSVTSHPLDLDKDGASGTTTQGPPLSDILSSGQPARHLPPAARSRLPPAHSGGPQRQRHRRLGGLVLQHSQGLRGMVEPFCS
jgi:hypothetical protein